MNLRRIMVLLAVMSIAGWLVGCADVPSTGPELPDITAQYRFVNAAYDAGTVGVTVIDSIYQTAEVYDLGSLSFKAFTEYQQFNAGEKLVVLSTGDSLHMSFSTKYYGTIIILPTPAGQVYRDYYKYNLRRYFDPETYEQEEMTLDVLDANGDVVGDTTLTLDRAGMAVINASLDTVDVKIERSEPVIPSTQTVFMDVSGMVLKDKSGVALPTGSYTITLAVNGTDVKTSQVTLANQRYFGVIVGSSKDGSLDLLLFEN